MTIARRLLILVAVPLLILGGLGLVVQRQLHSIESRSRFVAETQIGSLAALGNITRTFTEMRVNVRSALLTDDAGGAGRGRGRRSTRTGRDSSGGLRAVRRPLVARTIAIGGC